MERFMNKELEKDREYAAKYYRLNREKILANSKEKYATVETYRERILTASTKVIQANSIKVKARQAVRNAIYWKGLKRSPCEVCNEPKTHAHHEDYSKPLEVKWLCPTHHGEKHQKYEF